ncbi:MAG: phospho-N-acetylmuramoyl-pentapeptide-transferase [Lachnospiraceae bacterium]|nr:phospho-N-acetylmuramoyl-pentapeptide-transferase [Lachnospiraceae bacterium]
MDYNGFIALIISFIVGVVLCPILIPVLRKWKFGQNIREEGPEAHLKKSGTPTMGGVVILVAMLVGTVVFAFTYPQLFQVMLITFLFGIIGLIDDVLKIAKHQSEGLKAWQKMLLQIIVTVVFMLYITLASPNGTVLLVPFMGPVDFGFWFYPLAFIAILGTVNGANFTDGLDGLASTVTIVITIFLTSAAIVLGQKIAIAGFAMIGALMAFLIFNAFPAKIFMGDTGSLALGGFVCGMAFMLRMPIFLIIIAFVYLAEILSVILQVGYFKLTHGKRIFKMTPIHHHFELCGWSEVRVVALFSIATVLLGVLGFVGLMIAVL